jgi:glycosyltransferase involved in cell wall biosynthesis
VGTAFVRECGRSSWHIAVQGVSSEVHVRIVDYVLNPGGVARFIVETIRGFRTLDAAVSFEVVSYGPAAKEYVSLLRTERLVVPVTQIRPLHWWSNLPPQRLFNVRGTYRLMKLLGRRGKWDWELPAAAFQDCDVVWLPFMSRHRIPSSFAHKVVASCHDLLPIEEPLLHEQDRAIEIQLTRENLASAARIVANSRTTRDSIVRFFGSNPARISVIPLSTEHLRKASRQKLVNPLGELPFILCPAWATPHKNQAILIRAFARWRERGDCRLVLIGRWTNLADCSEPWSKLLRELAESLGLRLGVDLLGLGHVPSETRDALLLNAKAVVMPTLYEGFGLPLGEGVIAGVPVIASDIPVLREQAETLGAGILWFDPHDPDSLSARLRELQDNYSAFKRKAVEQVAQIRRRTWAEVAEEHLRVFQTATAWR